MTLVYNLSNEPWPKYNMAAIADHGLKPSQWTSARFQTQVLLMETNRCLLTSTLTPSCLKSLLWLVRWYLERHCPAVDSGLLDKQQEACPSLNAFHLQISCNRSTPFIKFA